MNSIARACRKSLYGFSLILIRISRLASKRPRMIAALFLILSGLFFANLGHLKFLFSAEDMVGEGIQSADELASIKERYDEGTSSFLYLVPPDGQFSFSLQELCQIRAWYSAVRVTHPEFKTTTSTFDVSQPVQEGNAVKYANVLPLDCDRVSSPKSFQEIQTRLNQVPWPTLRDYGNRLSLAFSFVFENAEDTKFGSFDPNAVGAIRQSVENDLLKIVPKAQAYWEGSADYQWYVLQGYRFSIWVNSAMILILLLSLRFFYGTWSSGFLFCVTLIFNGIWIYGAKALLGSAYDLLASGLFTMLAVAALEDFVFLSAEQMKGASWRQATRKMIVPSMFTSLTTMIGFLSLYTSDLAMIRRFGVWCAVGALLEWVMLFVFLPAILKLFYKKRSWVNPARASALALSENWSRKRVPRWATRMSLLIFPLAIAFFGKLSANDTPAAIFPAAHPYRVALQEIEHAKGWQATASLLMRDPTEFRSLESVVKRLEADPEGKSLVSAVETPERVVDWLDQSHVLSRDVIESNFLNSDPYKKLVDPEGIPRAILYLKDTSVEGLQRLKRIIAEICPDGSCHAGGDLIAYSDFATQIPRTLIDSMVVSLILVGLVLAYLALAFGKIRLTPKLLVSAFWGACTMLFVLAALHIPMNFMKCIFASVLVALTGDNTVQYLFAAKRADLRSGVARRATGSFQTTVFMILTSLMYLFSYFTPPKEFGLILATGLLIALLGDLWLLNGLLEDRTGKRRISPATPD